MTDPLKVEAAGRRILVRTAYSPFEYLRQVLVRNVSKEIQAFLLERAYAYDLDRFNFGDGLDEKHLVKRFRDTKDLWYVKGINIVGIDVSVEFLTLFQRLESVRIDRETDQMLLNLTQALPALPFLRSISLVDGDAKAESYQKFWSAVAQQANITELTFLVQEHEEIFSIPVQPYVRTFHSNVTTLKEVTDKFPALREYRGVSLKAKEKDILDLLVARSKTLESFAVNTAEREFEVHVAAAVPRVVMESLHKFELMRYHPTLAEFAAQNLIGAANTRLTTFTLLARPPALKTGPLLPLTHVVKQLDVDPTVTNLTLSWTGLRQPPLTYSTELRMPITELQFSPWVLTKGDELLLGLQQLQVIHIDERQFPGGVQLMERFLALIAQHASLRSFTYISHDPERVELYTKAVIKTIPTLAPTVEVFEWVLEEQEVRLRRDVAVKLQTMLLDVLAENRGLVVFRCDIFEGESEEGKKDPDVEPLEASFVRFLRENHTLVQLQMNLLFDFSKFEQEVEENGVVEYLQRNARSAADEVVHMILDEDIRTICVDRRLDRLAILSKQAASTVITRFYLANEGSPFRTSVGPLMKSISELAALPYSPESVEKAEKKAEKYYRWSTRARDTVPIPAAAQAVLHRAQRTQRVLSALNNRKRKR